MKKIIAFALAIICIFAVVSCSGGDKYKEQLDAFAAALDNTKPTGAKVVTNFHSGLLGDLDGEFNITYKDDGSSEIAYSYEEFAELTENPTSEEVKKTHTGTVTVDKNGKYTDGDSLNGTAAAATGLKINLGGKLTVKNASNTAITILVKAENTKDVIGTALENDVTLVLTKANDMIATVALSYTTLSGDVLISCAYSF